MRNSRDWTDLGQCDAIVLPEEKQAAHFKNGRQIAVFLGLTLKPLTIGGKNRLLGIHKHDNRYLRGLLIRGTRSAKRVADKERTPQPIASRSRKTSTKSGAENANVLIRNLFATAPLRLERFGSYFQAGYTLSIVPKPTPIVANQGVHLDLLR